MPLVLNEEQKLLKDTAREFIQANAPVEAFRHLRDSKDPQGYSSELWQQMGELGWASITLPEAYDGLDFGFTGLGVVLEEAGRTLARSPLFSSVVLGASAILLGGNEAQKQTLLPQIAAGQLTLALAVDEGTHHNPTDIATEARASGNGYVINGSKSLVIDGMSAQHLIVVTRTQGSNPGKDGISLFLVDAHATGVERQPLSMVDAHAAARIQLTNVSVPADALIGKAGEGFAILDQVLDRGRIAIAAEMLGNSQAMFERTMDYLKEREQFGVKIGSFQALKHRAAQMYIDIELCKSIVLEALQAIDDAPGKVPALASLVKSKVGETCLKVMDEATQMHGGIGVTDELDVGLFLKRSRVLNQLLGTPAFHRDRYASLHGY
ncbi:MAG: acyl-CoA dehydrogenase [Gammaproteobacteria bacterium]|nr:MAG: acyl-CoA dehydrogenase [Gammaproteobacteria bacterium]